MSIQQHLHHSTHQALLQLFQVQEGSIPFQVNETKPEFTGDYTIVLFSLLKPLKLAPNVIGDALGTYLVTNHEQYVAYNIIKGFLNITVSDTYYTQLLELNHADICYGKKAQNGLTVMVEYSSPNTNKPLHLGHLRNNFLGYSIAEIYKANGYNVVTTCIVNDRGIHICKSMVAWQQYANGATPSTTGIKGDHLVGQYYVQYNTVYKQQVAQLLAQGLSQKEAEEQAPILQAAKHMLLQWEQGHPAVMQLWNSMNSWVYQGFDATYRIIGSQFNKTYYESNTYLLGKTAIKLGLQQHVFYTKDDGSIWINLTADGLDEKLVQRKDGTSVYITQDIGLAQQKYEEYHMHKSIYVIGNEQDYHMAVLKLICQKLALPYANDIEHLSYGMVELPSGKMKSREGTVVDADDIITEMIAKSKTETAAHGKTDHFTQEELTELYTTIGLGATKFYLLRVDPKKKMVFNPEESIEFIGYTGPFVQYTHARIKSILRKNEWQPTNLPSTSTSTELLPLEKKLLYQLEQYETILEQAAKDYNPSHIAMYCFNIAQSFNSLYAAHQVTNAETEEKKQLRLKLCSFTATVISSAMQLLGIAVPERM